MATTNITNTSLKFNTAAAMPATSALDASGGCRISFKNREDARILIILENSATASKEATVKAGNSIQGVKDLTVSLDAGQKKVITLESGKYMNVSGTNAGYVVITGTADIKAAAVELP